MNAAPRRLGLLGGMTWESSIVYERLLNEGIRAALGGSHSADLVIRSYDFDRIADASAVGDWDGLAATFVADALLLEAAGAEAILICTNTMHKVASRVAEATSVPLLHIIDITADAILAARVDTVALLGTAYTMRDPFYRDHLRTRGIASIVPPEEDAATVHRIIYEELARGQIKSESREALRLIVAGLVKAGAQGVIAGCTEIPPLLGAGDVDIPYFDSLRLHVEAALAFSLGPTPT